MNSPLAARSNRPRASWHRIIDGGWFPPFVAVLLVLAALAQHVVAAPVDGKYDKTCTSAGCHPTPQKDNSSISHPPFLEEWCDRCHLDHTSNTKGLLKYDQPTMCLQCHKNVETDGSNAVHPPNDNKCSDCHNPHRSSIRHLLRSEELLFQCSSCHASDLEAAGDRPFHHKFFDPKTECGSCHSAHSATETRHLKPNLGETCLTCHDLPIETEGRPLENVGRELRESKVVHPPLKSLACAECHTPHGSNQSSLLRDSYPAGNYDTYRRDNYEMCWKCHSPEMVEMSPSREVTKFRNGAKNLHQVHVMNLKKGRACHLCHAPHASENQHLLRETVNFGLWKGPFIWKPTADGGTCATACHKPKEYNRSAP